MREQGQPSPLLTLVETLKSAIFWQASVDIRASMNKNSGIGMINILAIDDSPLAKLWPVLPM